MIDSMTNCVTLTGEEDIMYRQRAMESYAFEWSVVRGEKTITYCFGGRLYDSDQRAISAAMTMFRHRATNVNDTLSVYVGTLNGWGCIEGRYVGKVAYDQLGSEYRFVRADPVILSVDSFCKDG